MSVNVSLCFRLCLAAGPVFVAGCAPKPLHGVVTPLGGHQYKSFVKAAAEAGAMTAFDSYA